MKLQERPRDRRVRADQVLMTEQPTSSDIFDPRVDLPPGALERIKGWAMQNSESEPQVKRLLLSAWMRWIDPVFAQSIEGNIQVRDAVFSKFLHRRNGSRLTSPPGPISPNEGAGLAGSYLDIVELIEVFPEVREEIKAPEFAEDFNLVLRHAMRNVGSHHVYGANVSISKRILDLKTMIQVWPEHRAQIIQALAEGGQDIQRWFVKQVEGEPMIVHAMCTAADLTMVFPELRPPLEEVVKRRMPEIQLMLQQMHSRLGDERQGSNYYVYQRFIRYLTILGAESAVLDAQGDLQLKLRPLRKLSVARPLPDRLTA